MQQVKKVKEGLDLTCLKVFQSPKKSQPRIRHKDSEVDFIIEDLSTEVKVSYIDAFCILTEVMLNRVLERKWKIIFGTIILFFSIRSFI